MDYVKPKDIIGPTKLNDWFAGCNYIIFNFQTPEESGTNADITLRTTLWVKGHNKGTVDIYKCKLIPKGKFNVPLKDFFKMVPAWVKTEYLKVIMKLL